MNEWEGGNWVRTWMLKRFFHYFGIWVAWRNDWPTCKLRQAVWVDFAKNSGYMTQRPEENK